MHTLTPSMKDHLALRLASRTGLRTTTCHTILEGRYDKYSRRIRMRALDGIKSILATEISLPAAQGPGASGASASSAASAASATASFLGNLASGIAKGLTRFGSTLAKGAAAGVTAVTTGDTKGGEGEGDGGGEEGEGAEEE